MTRFGRAIVRKDAGLCLLLSIPGTRSPTFCGGDEVDRKIVTQSFDGPVVDNMVVADGVVSRKRQIGSPVQRTLEQ